MNRIADISAFMALQNQSVSVFNVDIDDLKTSVEDWMEQIDTLRELQADAEAEAEESKLEKVLDNFNTRIQSSIRAARTTITELKRNGSLEDTEDEEVQSDESDESESFGDFGSLMESQESETAAPAESTTEPAAESTTTKEQK